MKQIISIIILITIHMNLYGQKISVYNPFSESITPIKFDPNGGEYDNNPVEIIAVVSGQSQGGWSGHELYSQQMIRLESWKLMTDVEFKNSKLLVFRTVEKSRNYFQEIPKFSAVKLEVFLNKDQTRAVMLEGNIIITPDESISTEIESIKEVKNITVDSIGEFKFNHAMQNYQKLCDWLGEEIQITISVNSSDEISDEIETLNYLVNNQKKVSNLVMNYAVENILKDRNESWIEPGESTMSELTFKRYSKLESIYIEKNGNFSMDFAEEGNIFNGGFYMVNSNITIGPQSHEIGY